MKKKLLAIGLSVLVATSAVGAVNNFTAEPDLVDKTKKEAPKEYKQEVSDKPPLEREVERAEDTNQAEQVVEAQPTLADYPKQEVAVFEPIVEEAPAEPVQTPQPAQQPVQPAPEPVINKYKIVLTESVDYPNPRYADRIDRKCVHHMEDGTSRWMVSTLKSDTIASCFAAGTVMSPAQYIQFRTDPIPVQWR